MAFLGLRGTGDWVTNQRPQNWRETILYLYPNGSAPLTGLISMSGSESTDDPVFNWWTKQLPEQAGAVTGIFTNPDLAAGNAYSADNYSKGQVVYIKAAESVLSEFRVGHVAMLRDESNYNVDTRGEVTDRVLNGANSYVSVKLIQDTSAANDLDDVDRIMVIGNANAEGADMPDAVAYDPDPYSNYTQIFRTPLDITRTARKTRLRTGDAYKEAKRECLELHAIEMEKALLWGIKYSTTGANGKPKRYSQGVIDFINTYASDNVDDYVSNSEYAQDSWIAGGEEWLDQQLETIFRYGKNEKLALVGSSALRGINRLAKISGEIKLEPNTTDYGLQVVTWLSPYGTLHLKLHPLFSYEKTNRNSMLITEPARIKSRYIDDTFFKDDDGKSTKNNGRDGTKEEYLTELGWEFHHAKTMGYLNGVGKDNTVAA